MPNAEEPIPFGPLLRQCRIAAGLTQEALAERTGLGVRSIQHLEAGAHLPHRETVDRLLRVLDLSGMERRRFEGAAQPAPRPREIVSVPSGEAAGDHTRQPGPRHNLPAPLTSFVGRGQEMGDVKRLLRAHRLVTLTGSGGCGKTRLALQVAAELVDDFPDGVWLIELAPLADTSLVLPTLASAIGIVEQPPRPLLDTLVDALRLKQLVVLLDNCEHLLDVCAKLADTLLRGCPAVRILATSREVLGIAGEIAWRVPSLAVPPASDHSSPDQLDRYAAVHLFAERAAMVDPNFVLTAPHASAVAQIVRRLDGIPLAIELAAARAKVLSLGHIAARLDDQFRLLTGGSRTALPRHQTLRASIDWSYNLLTEPERRLFGRLSVFAGGWTLEAAESVCGEGGEDVLDLLTGLVDKSLVLVETTDEERYHLLETIRQYAANRLREGGEVARLRDRHRDWFLDLAEQAEPELIGPRQAAWPDRLATDQDNLRAALAWCRERETAELGLRLAGALYYFWFARDHTTEARGWLEQMMAIPGGEAITAARAKATLATWIFAQEMSDDAAARRVVEDALAIYRQLGDRRGTAWALRESAFQALSAGELARAESLHGEAVALATEIGDTWLVAQVRESLGYLAEDRGEPEVARRHYAESQVMFRALGDVRAICGSLRLLGRVAGEAGEEAVAHRYFEEALPLAREIRTTHGTSDVLIHLGMLEQKMGDRRRSLDHLAESLSIARQSGDRRMAVFALFGLGLAVRTEGDARHAHAHVEEALAIARQSGDRPLMAQAIRWCGMQALGEGMLGRGTRLLGAADASKFRHLDLARLLRAMGTPPEESSLRLAKAALGEEAFKALWAEGQAMTLEEAIAHALEEEDDG